MDIPGADIIVKVLVAILGAVGGVLAKKWFLHQKTRGKIKYLTWTTRYTHPMASRIQDFKMTFNGEECEGLSETRIVIWNESANIADSKDVAPASPIVWRPNTKHKVLSARVIQQTHQGVGATARWDSEAKAVSIAFDYLEPSDGFVVSVLHSGPPSFFGQYAPIIEGSIKGFGRVSGKLGDLTREGSYLRDTYAVTPAWSRRLWLTALGAVTVGMVYAISDVILNQRSETSDFLSFVSGLFLLVGLFVFLLTATVTMWRAKPPVDLTTFFETWEAIEVPKVSESANQPLNADARQSGSARPPRSG